MLDKAQIIRQLQAHLIMLTRTIGERSVRMPDHLEKSASYIQAQWEGSGLTVQRQTYRCKNLPVSNVVARMQLGDHARVHYVIGAHYDCVPGTVGADDNASAVAVLLETARILRAVAGNKITGVQITFVAFALEESPAYGTAYMGSRVFVDNAIKENTRIDGMICLEMVGYTCRKPGCQRYPFPLRFLGYPKVGAFIGIVGNRRSLVFTRRLRAGFQRNADLPVVTLTVPFNGWIMPAVRLSDHVSFWNRGYPAVMVTDSAFYRNPHYHLPSDVMQTLDLDFMADLVRSLVEFFCSKG